MNIELAQAYAEIDYILSHMPENYRLKVPVRLRNKFKEEKDESYKVDIKSFKHLKDQNLAKKTLSILAMLKYNYWCKDEIDKERIAFLLRENEGKYQESIREEYGAEDIFKKSKQTGNLLGDEVALVEYKEGRLNKFVDFFKRLFLSS